MRQPKHFIFYGLLPLFIAALATRALAGFAVSPLQQKIVVKPGRVARFDVTVKNVIRKGGGAPITLRARLLDFAVNRKGKLSFGRGLEEQRSSRKWIELPTETLTVEPGESKRISGTVSPPLDAEGDYWAALVIAPPENQETGSGVQVRLRTASGVFVRVKRRSYLARPSLDRVQVEPPKSAQLQKKQASQDADRGLQVVADVRNTGQKYFSCSGDARLYDEEERWIGTIPLRAERSRILPGDVRRFRGTMARPLPPGTYTVRVVSGPSAGAGRKAFKRTTFTVHKRLASVWSEYAKSLPTDPLQLDKDTLEVTACPGRFTVTKVPVKNAGRSTLRVTGSTVGTGRLSEWIKLEGAKTLRAGQNCGLTFRLKIPRDVEMGQYTGVVTVKGKRAGIRGQRRTESKDVEVTVKIRSVPR